MTNSTNRKAPSTGLKLSDFATPLKAEHHFVKVSFSGFAGSGKSRTSSEFIRGLWKQAKIKKPLLFIDNEQGGRFLLKQFEKDGIEVVYKQTEQLADVIKAMDFLKSGEIGGLFVDTLTKIWYKYVRDYRAINKRTFMTLQDWGKILPAWQEEFSDRFVEINGNFIFTGRGGFEYEKEDDEVNEAGTVTKKGQFIKSGVKMKLAGETAFEPDLNIWMSLEQSLVKGKPVQYRNALITKDRSGMIDGKNFKNPTFENFKPFVSYVFDIPLGKVAHASNTENNAPHEDSDYWRNKELKDIEKEKIENTFDKAGFTGSQSKETKRIGILVMEKIFETSSMTEVMKMTAPELKKRRIMLVSLLSELEDIEDRESKELHIREFETDELAFVETDTDLHLK